MSSVFILVLFEVLVTFLCLYICVLVILVQQFQVKLEICPLQVVEMKHFVFYFISVTDYFM